MECPPPVSGPDQLHRVLKTQVVYLIQFLVQLVGVLLNAMRKCCFIIFFCFF